MAENSPSRDQSALGVLGLTAQIVSAHVSNNKVAPDELAGLIRQVYHALSGSDSGTTAVPTRPQAPAERPKPAVPISKSVFNDYIVCLEDGKKLKMLKRHLQTAYNMSPEQYRAKWALLELPDGGAGIREETLVARQGDRPWDPPARVAARLTPTAQTGHGATNSRISVCSRHKSSAGRRSPRPEHHVRWTELTDFGYRVSLDVPSRQS